MLKRSSIRKICLASFCLLILLVLYLFPKSENSDNLKIVPKTNYTITNASDTIYLLDNKDYVSRINVALSASETQEKALEMIDYLTVNSNYKNLIPNGFKAIIPSGTKVLSSDLKDKNFKINFNKNILEIDENYEMRLIESLIYSLTSIDGIDSITVLVDGKILSQLPNSKEYLPNPLDRSYGINKKYDINSIKNATKTTLYYLSKNNDFYYYVPVTKVSNSALPKIEIIIKELATSPLYETNLMSYLNSETTLQNYEILDNRMNIDFNNAILSDITKEDILEEVTYAINLSIKDNYNIDSVMYTVNSKEIVTFDLKALE